MRQAPCWIGGILATATLLSGCIASEKPLLDGNAGVHPIQPGRYQVQEYVVGNWINRQDGRLKLADSTYTWTEKPGDKEAKDVPCADSQSTCIAEPADALKFTLHEIGGGLLLAMVESNDDRYHHVYDLLEITPHGAVRYGMDCESAQLSRGSESVRMESTDSTCNILSADGLKAVARAFAKRRFPSVRYVWTGP